MSLQSVNHLNSVLMLLACALAFALPFEGFLFAYAVLGPLHYLTQISWLHDRQYFAKRRMDAGVLVGFTVAATVVAFTVTSLPTAIRIGTSIGVLVVSLALVMTLTESLRARLGVLLGLGILLAAFQPPQAVITVFGLLLPSLIHVFVFTALFLLFGSLKAKSGSGYLSFVVMMACGASFFLFMPDAPAASPSMAVRAAYGPFVVINQTLAGLLGLEGLGSLEAVFRSPVGVATTRFIAFAYTYHYLNWFSKTKVIGWHEITRRRAWALIVLWLAAITVYFVDYRYGFLTLYGLSLAHVFLELPLDHQAIIGIGREVRGRLMPAAGA